MGKEYHARKGSFVSEQKVQTYGEYLEGLSKEQGFLTPHLVVERARSVSSPIHDFFDWDDGSAAEKYRLHQARQLVASIEVYAIKDEEPIKAFFNIEVKEVEEDKNRYVSLENVVENPEYLDIVVSNAQAELVGWNKRYSQYKKLGRFRPMKPVFTSIKQVLDKIPQPKVKRQLSKKNSRIKPVIATA